MKPFSFFFHYNKPLSQKWGRNVMSIHYKGACLFVESLTCNVPTSTRDRKSQPRCVITGKANNIRLDDRNNGGGVFFHATIS